MTNEDAEVCEMFLGFTPIFDFTGKEIYNIIIINFVEANKIQLKTTEVKVKNLEQGAGDAKFGPLERRVISNTIHYSY